MITLLFENDSMLKETSFSSFLINYSNIKLLKRKSEDLVLDVNLLNPDLLFIRLSPSNKSFFEKVNSVHSKNENVKIVLLVDYCSEYLFWIADKFKIDGIINKDIESDEFYSTVISLVDSSIKDSCSVDKSTINFKQFETLLTNSEKRIFKLIGEGLTSLEISDLLCVSHRTVDCHRAQILNKLNCKTAAKLICIASIYNLFLLL